MSAKAARGHRPHVKGGRRTASPVYLSTDERAVIEVAAGRVGLRRGAYIAAAAVRAARADLATEGVAASDERSEGPVPLTPAGARELIEEVRTIRRLTGNLAGNVNDLARAANSTGELKPETEATLDYLRRFNARFDDELMGLLRRLR